MFRALLSTRRGRISVAIVSIVTFIAVAGPWFAPYAPDALVSAPGSPPSSSFPLGTDYLGRDVLSRVLWGGRSVLWLALAATLLTFLVGTSTGLIAGYSRSLADPVIMRTVDVILAFPPLLFFILVTTSFGNSQLVLIVGIAVVQTPGIVRIVYSPHARWRYRGT